MSELRRFRGNSTLGPRSASSFATASSSPLPVFLPGIASTLRSLSALNRQERSMADHIGQRELLGHGNAFHNKIALEILGLYLFIISIRSRQSKNYGTKITGENIYEISLIMYGLCQLLAYQICRVTYYYPEPLNSKPKPKACATAGKRAGVLSNCD